jgi:hypothetical protein
VLENKSLVSLGDNLLLPFQFDHPDERTKPHEAKDKGKGKGKEKEKERFSKDSNPQQLISEAQGNVIDLVLKLINPVTAESAEKFLKKYVE